MQRLMLAWVGVLLGLGLAACQSGGADGCHPGTNGCECIVSECFGDLICTAGICVGDFGSLPEETEGETGPDPTGDMCDEPEPINPYPAQQCLPDVPCANDSNCPDGHLCNTGLEPPACQLLYCGTEGSICHADEDCDENFQCHEGQCNRCDICGDLCEVDFDSDPQHCGCCDSGVPIGGVCKNGVAQCPEGQSVCDGACFDLEKDTDNCGSCGNQLGPGVMCVNGTPTCPTGYYEAPLLLCDGTCVEAQFDDDNCGECGATCPDGSSCSGFDDPAQCNIQISWTNDPDEPINTCTVACAQLGMACDSEGGHRVWYDGWCEDPSPIYSLDCSDLPPASVTCGDYPSCDCELETLSCDCRPIPP
jgi:hypothetical protein